MNIQSLSIVVPTGKCWNKCEFCVSRMHEEDYGKSIIDNNIPQSYLDRVEYVREEGCNSLIFTGTAEPQQNLQFIYKFLLKNKELRKPFYNIAIQTTGTNLTVNDINALAVAGVNTLALSISSFYDEINWDIINAPIKVRTMKIEELVAAAHKTNMNVRLCLNLTSAFAKYCPEDYFGYGNYLDVEQMTFRKIYADGDCEAANWVYNHQFDDRKYDDIIRYVEKEGTPICTLPYGYTQYSVNGISTVIDNNCMAKQNINEMKYAILRSNGKLYSRWDDKGSLIF